MISPLAEADSDLISVLVHSMIHPFIDNGLGFRI
jgi:hypothetical protein